MGWGNYHLYDFEVTGIHYGDPDPEWGIEIKSARNSSLCRLVLSEGTTFAYVYDMGDNWEHEILLEKILLPESGKRYPVCLTGRRGCPPEDCGGSGGYAELLEIIKNPDHEEYLDRIEWLGGEFDPEAFDADGINELLKGVE
jgi:hypothetical protein